MFCIIIMSNTSTENTQTAIYNESNPLVLSNFLYSGTYSGLQFYTIATPSSGTKFCFFTPEQVTFPSNFTARTQISTVTDISLPLVRTNALNGTTINWGSGNSLLNTNTLNTRSFGLKDTTNKYITLTSSLSNYSATASSNQWYMYPYFFPNPSNGIPTNIPSPTNILLPFSRCITIMSPTFGSNGGSTYLTASKSTTQTISIQNKNIVAQQFNLNAYLGTSTNNISSVNNIPYGVRFTVADSLNSTVLSTNTTNDNNNVYCIESIYTTNLQLTNDLVLIRQKTSTIQIPNFILSPNQVLYITLMKIVASPVTTGSGSNVVGTNDVAVLFVDIDDILYKPPSLTLSSLGGENINNVNTYYYGNETDMRFECVATPNNINADRIVEQNLKLDVYKLNTNNSTYLLVDSINSNVDASNIASFSIDNNNKYISGQYKAVVSYTPPLTNNFLPDKQSHYTSGSSNEIFFNIEKQPIDIIYNPTKLINNTNQLSDFYSILSNANFNDFLINNSKSKLQDKTISIPGDINFKVRDSNDNLLIELTKNNFNELNFIPKDNNLTYALNYKFQMTFIPQDTEILPYTTYFYYFTTETPFIQDVLYANNNTIHYELLLSYLENATMECVLTDSKGNKYDSSVVFGNCIANFYKDSIDSSKDINLQLNYNNTSKTWKNVFSPKTLNLLRYILSNFKIVSSFTLEQTNGSQLILTTSNNTEEKCIRFNGIELITLLNNNTINAYDTITISSSIKDNTNNDVYSILDIDGSITYNVKYNEQFFKIQNVTSQDQNKLFVYSFVPNDLQMSKFQSPFTIETTFTFSDVLITPLNDSKTASIELIKPIISITPKSEINDYRYKQTFQVTLTGIPNINDSGILILYGKPINPDNFLEVSEIQNTMLNNSYTITNIDVDNLVEDNVLANLQENQLVNGIVKWIPNRSDIYESIQDTFQIILSKTSTYIKNVTISNYAAVFTEQIIVSGEVSTDYNESLEGTVILYDVSDINKSIIAQSNISSNKFSLIVTSPNVVSYTFGLKFIPTYTNVYNDTTYLSDTNIIIFNKVIVVPNVTITNLNTNVLSSDNNLNMVYTNNFKINVTNIDELNGTIVKISIGDEYISEELTITNGEIQTDNINYFELNKLASPQIDISTLKPVVIDFIGYMNDEFLNSHYDISNTTKNILFIKDLNIPKINTITFTSQVTNKVSTSLNYDELFTISGNFDLIKDVNNNIIPLSGSLLLFVGSIDTQPIVLNENLILDSEDKIIVNEFKSSFYNIVSGNKTFIFKFVPNDINIQSSLTTPLSYNITTATIDQVTLNLYPKNSQEVTYFGEKFDGELGFFNIGVTGSMKIYCINPKDNTIRQEIASISIGSTDENKGINVLYNFECNPINFDCPSNITTYDIVVVFISGDAAKFSDNEMEQIFNYSISRIEVKLSALEFDDVSFSDFPYNNQRIVGDILTINGSIQTLNNEYIKEGKVEIIAFNVYDEDGINFSNIPENTVSLYDANRDNTTNTDYVNVSADGTFTCKILLTSNVVFFYNPGTFFQILYRNDKNYANKYFSYEEIPGIYDIYINNKDIDLSLIYLKLNQSNLTNSYEFSYHEDILHFFLEIHENYDETKQPSAVLQLVDGTTGELIGNGNSGSVGIYNLQVTSLNKSINGENKTIYFSEIYLNPKTENITKNINSNYSAFCVFNAIGYNTATEFMKDNLDTQIQFNIRQTVPVIDLEFRSAKDNSVISNIDYEESVNILVKVRPFYNIQQHVSQNNNIPGKVILRNQNNTNEDGTIMNVLYNSQIASDIIFDNSINEKIVTYSPKNNSDTIITEIQKIFSFFSPDPDDPDVETKYTTAKFSKYFTISKYTPTLEITTINPVNDVIHSEIVDKVDEQYVYYDDVLKIKYNGYVNFNEQFQVTCSLIKNLPGTIDYYYSYTTENNITNNIFTKIIPIESTVITGKDGEIDDTNYIITATFNEKLLQIPSNHLYCIKTVFNPKVTPSLTNGSYFYNSDESPLLYFNIFQSNNFGIGKIFWNTNNNTDIVKTVSYNSSQTIEIFVSFEFDQTVNISDKRCEVTFFHTSFEDVNNKFYQPIYFDLRNQENNKYITTSFTVPATTFLFKSISYSIRALFKPVLDDNSKNLNYPIVVERSPLTLNVKPFITANKFNFNYQYSEPISFDLVLNSGNGITDITPYEKLVFLIKNYDDSTETYNRYYEQLFTGVNVSLPNFQNIINTNGINLRPGKYSLSVYATNINNSDIVKTEPFVTTFTITKKSVTLSLTFDKYNLSYRSNLKFLLNIGNFPIEVGNIDITFTNVETNKTIVTNIYSNVLISSQEFLYSYTNNNISSLLSSGLYTVSANLENIYYSGSQPDNINGRLLVNPETNVAIHLDNSFYTIISGQDLVLTTKVKFNNVENISTGQLNMKINNGNATSIDRDFTIASSLLTKDVNNVVLYFNDENYITKSLAFQVNVKKILSDNMSRPMLTFVQPQNNENNFQLQLSNYNMSDTVTFYILSKITKILPSNILNNFYTFNFTDLSYGNNTIYAVVRSVNYDIKSTEVNVVRYKYNSSISLVSTTFLDSYYANTLINITYNVVKVSTPSTNISNNGIVEFHKLTYDDEVNLKCDEIIEYVNVINNIAQLSNYKLVPNAQVKPTGEFYDNKIKFYAKFTDSIDYTDSESEFSPLINIKTKSASRIIDDTVLAANYKLGDIVTLEYIATKALSSYNSVTNDDGVRLIVNAEQQAIIDVEEANKIVSDKLTLLNNATSAYETAVTTLSLKNGDLNTAKSDLDTALSQLNQSKTELDIAKSQLDSVTIEKEKAELAYRIILETAKLNNVSFPVSNANNSISEAETTYNTAKSNYETTLNLYNSILDDIKNKETDLDSMTTIMNNNRVEYDNALLDVTNKETSLNTAQLNYQNALDEYNDKLKDVVVKQNEINDLRESLASIEDDYDTKKANYDNAKLIYDEKLFALTTSESGKNTAQTNYNLANANYINNYETYNQRLINKTTELETATNNYNGVQSLLNIENSKAFSLANLTNMWIVINQQSVSVTPQNPFIIVYTIKDSSVNNAASWYKSKLFYGSNTNANNIGPMLLYTGEDPVEVHTEITNRVKLDYNSGLSAGLQNGDEIIKTISIQTSSNATSTNINDYNFIFKEFGTIGTTANSTISFIPTSVNNTQNVYADGVQGTNVDGGWSFNNDQLTSSGQMPKINWYIHSNMSEYYSSQLSTLLVSKNTAESDYNFAESALTELVNAQTTTNNTLEAAKSAYDTAEQIEKDEYVIFKQKEDAFTPVKTTYELFLSSISMKETDLIDLNLYVTSSQTNVEVKLEFVNVATSDLTTAKNNLTSKEVASDTAKNNFNQSLTLLNNAKAMLTTITNGKTVKQQLDLLLIDKNDKYVIWKSFVEYVNLLENNTSTSITNILSELSNETFVDFDSKFSLWNNAINRVSNYQTLYDSSVTNHNTEQSNYNTAHTDEQASYINKNTAQTSYYTAQNDYNIALENKNTAITNAKDVLDAIVLTQGCIIIYKEITKDNTILTQVLGKLKPNERGLVTLSYKFVETGTVKFYARITDLPNYYDSQTNLISTSIFERNDITIQNNTIFDGELYKINDNVILNYKVFKKLNATPVTEGYISIYKKAGLNEQLLAYYSINQNNNGSISHTHTLIESGIVSFYAKYIYSINNEDKIGDLQTINVIDKLNSSIEDISESSITYKLGNMINLSYKVTSTNTFNISGTLTSKTSNIAEGVMEVHKVINGIDEIISYLDLTSGSNGMVTMTHKLVDVGSVEFYANYMGTKNYHPTNNKSSLRTIDVVDKYTVTVKNVSELSNPISKKLGNVVTLKYDISHDNLPVNEGIFEITKNMNINGVEFKEILGYALINNGIATFTHKLVDIDCQISLKGTFINSTNYKEVPSLTNHPNVINVFSKYNSKITRTSNINTVLPDYKLGDSLQLEYGVTNNNNEVAITDGNIYIHKVVSIPEKQIDEIIYYGKPNNVTGKVSYTHKIETIGNISFYGVFKDSSDYYDSSSNIDTIISFKEYLSAQNTITASNNSPKYGENITLTSAIQDGEKTISEGIVEFYVIINGSQQLIGINTVSNNQSIINYTVNDMGEILFISFFKNSSNYIDVTSNQVSINVIKNNIQNISFSPINAVQFDILSIDVNIIYGAEIGYQNLGTIDFIVTNNNISSTTNIDIIGSTATYKLVVANTMQYTVKAQYKGNDLFNESNMIESVFTPLTNNNYQSLTYTETAITSNYYNINTVITLNDNFVDETFVLLNSGYVMFESYENGVLKTEKSVTVPLVDGKAQCKVRKETNYSYVVKFVDTLTDPKIIITGSKI